MGSLLIVMWSRSHQCWVSALQLLLSWSLDRSSALVCTRLDSVAPKQVGEFCCWFQLGVWSGFSCVTSQKLGLLEECDCLYMCWGGATEVVCFRCVWNLCCFRLGVFLDRTKFRNAIYMKSCNLVCISPQLKIQTISPNSRSLLEIISFFWWPLCLNASRIKG